MLKAVSTESTVKQVLPNHNQCIVHYIDISNTHLAIEYLKAAWHAGSINHRHLYCVSSPVENLIELLNFTNIVDFQRLVIIVPVTVNYIQ